jgi:hypothetical protein
MANAKLYVIRGRKIIRGKIEQTVFLREKDGTFDDIYPTVPYVRNGCEG